MDFVCIRQCFVDDRLWDVGSTMESDTDLTEKSKKKEVICWKKVGDTTADAIKGERKTSRELWKMDEGELILYADSRYKGTKLEPTLTKSAMVNEIKILEKAKEREDKIGII